MRNAKGQYLKDEDRILWEQVAKTVTPTVSVKRAEPRKTVRKAAPAASAEKPQNNIAPAVPPAPVVQKPKVVPGALAGLATVTFQPAPKHSHLDKRTHGKLAKGRLEIEARVDLHGMRQDEAWQLLQSFLSRAHSRGVRFVLVITGKGSSSSSDGVLRRSVPGWLSTAPFKPYVSAYESAAIGHGGEGALYVRLKRSPVK